MPTRLEFSGTVAMILVRRQHMQIKVGVNVRPERDTHRSDESDGTVIIKRLSQDIIGYLRIRCNYVPLDLDSNVGSHEDCGKDRICSSNLHRGRLRVCTPQPLLSGDKKNEPSGDSYRIGWPVLGRSGLGRLWPTTFRFAAIIKASAD